MHQAVLASHTNTTLLVIRFCFSPSATDADELLYDIKDITHLHSSVQAIINK